MIDLHAHILPGIDDGPRTRDAAVEMARAAARAGTHVMAATPHIDAGFGVDVAGLAAARDSLAHRLASESIELAILQGGEVAPDHLPRLDDDELAAVTLGGGPTVLLECPFTPVGAAMEAVVADLGRRGFAVLLAHPERSPTFARRHERLAALVALGAAAQVTAGSLAGRFGEPVRRTALGMLEAGLVHVVASDTHDAVRRSPDLRLAAEALATDYEGVEEQLGWMTRDAPAALVVGDPLPERPPLPRRRRGLARLRAAWSAR